MTSSLYTLLTATDLKPQKSYKGNVNDTNIDIQAMLVWLTLPFYDFCGFRSVGVNSVYKLQFFTFIINSTDSTLLVKKTLDF